MPTYLKSPKNIEDLNVELELGNYEALPAALADIARAKKLMTIIAKKLGVSRTTLYQSLSKNGNPAFETIAKVACALGLRLALVPLTKPPTPKASEGPKIPLLSQMVSCGEGTGWFDEPNINGYVDIASLVPLPMAGRTYAFNAQGNSMLGVGIKDGDYVLFGPEESQHHHDGIYVFSLDGEVSCKQLEFDKISNRIKIYSLRDPDLEKAELLKTLDTQDTGFGDRFHIFGRVFRSIHLNFMDKEFEPVLQKAV